MDKADLWHARLALKTLRRDQREAIAAGCFLIRQTGGRAGRVWDTSAAGSLVLRRMDRRETTAASAPRSG